MQNASPSENENRRIIFRLFTLRAIMKCIQLTFVDKYLELFKKPETATRMLKKTRLTGKTSLDTANNLLNFMEALQTIPGPQQQVHMSNSRLSFYRRQDASKSLLRFVKGCCPPFIELKVY